MDLRLLSTPLCLALIAATLTACKGSSPVQFTIGVPQVNTVAFQANLTQTYGMDLSGNYALPKDYGMITLSAETATSGMGLGISLNTGAFVPTAWVDYQEATTLPTGVALPLWISTPVVDIDLPSFHTGPVSYHAYVGVRGQWYVGVTGLVKQINENFPAVNLGYTFRDSKGNVVVGLNFFAPKLDTSGHAEVPGGIFVGTNLTPLLAGIRQPQSSAPELTSTLSPELMAGLNEAADSGQPISMSGQSVVVQRLVTGPQAGEYHSNKRIDALMNRYMTALRNAQ
jgi:hypothetical protein